MNLLAEISMYPLQEDYLAPIDAFIAALNDYSGLEVTTNRMSTQVFGEFDHVMRAISECMRSASANDATACFACKFIPGAERSINGYQ